MTKQDGKIFISLTFLLTVLPTMVFANAGSPMILFGILHLLFLNAFIGWAESAILSAYKIRNRLFQIILANYLSMFVGLFFIAPYFSHNFWGLETNYGHYQLPGFIAGMTVSFIATLIIEYPFFYFALEDKTQKNILLKPFIVANTTTNAIMFLIYFWIADPQTNNKLNSCSIDKQDTLGQITVTLPDCYKIITPDITNQFKNSFLVKDDSFKLEFSSGGLGTLTPAIELQKNKSATLLSDTVDRHYLRQIAYFTKADKFGLVINIIDLQPATTTLIDTTHRYYWKLNAYTNQNVSLTKDERDILINSFKNCKINK